MNNSISKAITAIVTLIIAAAVFASLRSEILTQGAAREGFLAIFENLPFCELIATVLCNVFGMQNLLQGMTASGFWFDASKIMIMTILTPFLVSLAMRMFLKMPAFANSYEAEEYMNSLGYRIKEMIITVICYPLVAVVASLIVSLIEAKIQASFGYMGTLLSGVVLTVLTLVVSTIILSIRASVDWRAAFRVRLATTVIGKFLVSFGTDVICIFIVLLFLNDHSGAGFGMIAFLVVYLIGMDLMMKAVLRGN